MRKTTTKPFSLQLVRIFCMALLVLCSVSSFAQNTAGKDFWFAQTINLADKNGDIAILISNKSTSQTTVTITNPVRGTITRTLSPAGTTNSIDSVFLTSENLGFFDNINNTLVPKTSGTFVNNVYHITATNDIVAYAFTPWVNVISNDASLLIPTNSLGRKYFAGSYVSATPVNAFNSFFGIIATEDGTTVDIYNKTNSANPASVSPTSTVTLNKGQYYQYLNGNTQANDVTGWYLQANKNINVVSGNQCTNVGTAASCDHIEEQLLPVENLAKTYIASPSRTRGTIVNNVVVNAVPDIFRVVASEDGTSVTTNLNGTTYNLNRGQFVDILSNVPFKIEGTKPIYAYQIFASQNSNYTAQGYGRQSLVGDPSMVVVPLIDQFLYTYTFINGQTYPTNYVNITAPAGTNILLDGAPLPANTTWVTAGTVNGITYQCANVRVSANTHKIEGDQRFGITTYGWGDFASYGYLGGSGMQPINAGCITGGPYQLLSCTTSPTYAIQLNGTAACETAGVTPIISWTSTNPQVTFSNSTIANPIVTVPGAGTYSISMRVTCGGNTVTCTTDVIVREPVVLGGCTSTNPPSIQAPPTVIVPSDANQNYASNVALGNAITNVPAGPGVVTNNAPSQFPFGESTVVWTVTDAFGRTASANQTVIVVPPPTIVAPPAITVANDAGETYATIGNIGIATYTSDYGPDVLTSNAPANNQYPLGTTTVTWTIKDGFNRTASATQVITVTSVPPTIVAPPAITVTAGYDGIANINTLGNATYTVSVNNASVSNNAIAGKTEYAVGTYTITWTVTDGLGRTANDNQVINVVPPLPVIAPPADVTVSNNPGKTYATAVNIGTPTFSAVGPYTLTNDAPTQFPLGETIVTWTLTDAYGETVTTRNKVTVVSEPPTIVAPPTINVVADYNGFATVNNLGTPTTTTSVDPATIVTIPNTTQFAIGTTFINWTVADGIGRTATDVQKVIVSVPAPQINPPADITISNDPGEQYSTQVTLVDPVYQAVGPVTLKNDAPAQFSLGTTTVTWTLTDAYGNTVTTTNKVTVTSVAPTIVAPPTITVTAGYNGFATVNDLRVNGNETVTVSVNPATVTNNNSSTQYAIGTTNITWTVTDGINRTASDVQQVVVLAPLPKLNPVPDVTVPNNPGVNYATVTLVPPTYDAIGPVTLTNDAPAQFPIGTTIVTWTLTDVYGKTTTTTQKVIVTSVAPTIVAPPTITVTAGYNGFATVNDLRVNGNETVTASVNPATVTNNNSSTQYAIGTTNITWTVTDGINRTASDVQQVIVLAPLPKLNPVPDVTIPNNPGVNYATVTLVPPTYDAIGPVTLTNDAPAQFPIGTTIVTWTLTDVYGKTTTTTQKVTVTSAPPTIVPPAAITVTAAAGQTSATITNIGTATYTVSVNPATLTKNAPVNNVYPVGTTTVVWTVTDGLGRSISGSQTITVLPSQSCSFNTSITAVKQNCNIGHNCGNNNSSCSHGNGGANPSNATTIYMGYGPQTMKLQVSVPGTGGPFSYQWTGSGLSSTTSSAPTFTPTAEGNFTFTVTVKNANNCTSTSTIKICVIDVRVLDNKGKWDGKKVYICHLPPGNPANVQTISISINALDTHVPNHGGDKLGECNVVCDITPVDTLPAITAPADITINNNTGVAYATGVNLGNANITALKPATISNNAPSQFPVGTTTVTWTVTDRLGRTATDVQTVTVVAPAPSITAPAAKTVTANSGNVATGVSLGTPAYSVSVNPATVSNNAPSQFPIGNTTVTWTVKDGLGRTATATQVITVVAACQSYSISVSATPSSNTYTGGVPTNIYLGYGPQSASLRVNAPSSGAPYTYSWSGSKVNKLSSTTSASPVFSPDDDGSYTFTVTVTNKNGCKSTASITFCVKDIRVSSSQNCYGDDDDDDDYRCGRYNYNSTRVYINYYGQNYQVNVSQVSCYVRPGCNTAYLGRNNQSCGTVYARGAVNPEEVPVLSQPLSVKATPNPTTNYFILQIKGGVADKDINVRVVDALGREVYRQTTVSNSLVSFGQSLTNGIYYAEVIQGKEKKTVKLMKN